MKLPWQFTANASQKMPRSKSSAILGKPPYLAKVSLELANKVGVPTVLDSLNEPSRVLTTFEKKKGSKLLNYEPNATIAS